MDAVAIQNNYLQIKEDIRQIADLVIDELLNDLAKFELYCIAVNQTKIFINPLLSTLTVSGEPIPIAIQYYKPVMKRLNVIE